MKRVVCEQGDNVEDNGEELNDSGDNNFNATLLVKAKVKEHTTLALEKRNKGINDVMKKLTYH
jgi:hypothetical protein